MTKGEQMHPEQVRVGARVVVEFVDDLDNRERMTFVIVREQFADFDRGLLGVQTPLAKAILAKPAGVTVSYRMGDIRQVTVMHVEPADGIDLQDTEARRQQALRAALEKVERTNAEVFAASYSGKWGDYQLDNNQMDQHND